MSLNFFLEMFKIKCRFQKCSKNLTKIFIFSDNLNWIRCGKISLLPREYLPSGVKVLTKGLKVLDTIKTKIHKLKFSQSHGKVWWDYCRPDFSRLCGTLTCWLSYDVLKYDSLDISISTFSAVYNFKNT